MLDRFFIAHFSFLIIEVILFNFSILSPVSAYSVFFDVAIIFICFGFLLDLYIKQLNLEKKDEFILSSFLAQGFILFGLKIIINHKNLEILLLSLWLANLAILPQKYRPTEIKDRFRILATSISKMLRSEEAINIRKVKISKINYTIPLYCNLILLGILAVVKNT